MAQSPHEARPLARFGVSAHVLQRAEHLRDVVEPLARAQLFIQDRSAYTVTPERLLVLIGLLETLVQMTDDEILTQITQLVGVHQPHAKQDLRTLRAEASFLTQEELATFMNQQAAPLHQKPVISSKTSLSSGKRLSHCNDQGSSHSGCAQNTWGPCQPGRRIMDQWSSGETHEKG